MRKICVRLLLIALLLIFLWFVGFKVYHHYLVGWEYQRKCTLWADASLMCFQDYPWYRTIEVLPGTNWILEVSDRPVVANRTMLVNATTRSFFVLLGPTISEKKRLDVSGDAIAHVVEINESPGTGRFFNHKTTTGRISVYVEKLNESYANIRGSATLNFTHNSGTNEVLRGLNYDFNERFKIKYPDENKNEWAAQAWPKFEHIRKW